MAIGRCAYKGELPLIVDYDVQPEHWVVLSLQHLDNLKLIEMKRIAVQVPCTHEPTSVTRAHDTEGG